jgi:hypothetical protein
MMTMRDGFINVTRSTMLDGGKELIEVQAMRWEQEDKEDLEEDVEQEENDDRRGGIQDTAVEEAAKGSEGMPPPN